MSLGTTTKRADHLPKRPSFDQLAKAISPALDDIVYISGSRLEGFGNEHSDYDVYVIQRSGPLGVCPVTVILDGAYVVYDTVTYAHAIRILDSINSLELHSLPDVWALSLSELDFYYRLLIGMVLVNEREYARLKAQCRKDTIDALVHAWCGLRAVVHLDEATLKLAIGRHVGSYMAAHRAASEAIDAFLARNGESYPGFKWRFDKLQRCVGESSTIFQRAWNLKSLGSRTIVDYVDDVSRFCDDLGVAAAFDGWSLGRLCYRRVATATRVDISGISYIIENKTSLFKLTKAGQIMWEWIDGVTSRHELIERCKAQDVMSEGDADEFLCDLLEHGLIN